MTDVANPDTETIARAVWLNMKRRRRIVVGLVLTLITVSWITWRITHRQDPQFVGTWLFTWGTEPSFAELRNQTQGTDRLEWTINADGTGQLDSEFWFEGMEQHSYSTFNWRTDGECIHVRWGNPQTGWAAVRRTYADIRRILQGETLLAPDVYAYAAAAETDGETQQFLLQFETASGLRTDDVYYLTRIPTE
jgi:hypothetical protein